MTPAKEQLLGGRNGCAAYALLEMIGRGGFAVVWKAFDPEQKGLVALKVLHPPLAGDAVRRERFFRGAREMAGIEHAGIVRVLVPSEEDEGFHFFVMEHVVGGDLQHAVLKGEVARERALPIVLAVGEALAIAHAKGLVHRDVKPANILLGAGCGRDIISGAAYRKEPMAPVRVPPVVSPPPTRSKSVSFGIRSCQWPRLDRLAREAGSAYAGGYAFRLQEGTESAWSLRHARQRLGVV